MLHFLITRPEPKASELVCLLETRGYKATAVPALEITIPKNPRWPKLFLQAEGARDIFIFSSPNAVAAAFQFFTGAQKKALQKAAMVAIGRGTQAALFKMGMTQIHCPAGVANSEAVLNLPVLQKISGRKIWVFRGNGGRALLPKTLQQRGAEVVAITSYYRRCPATSVEPLIKIWQKSGFTAVVITSISTLKNLWKRLGSQHQKLLQKTPITVMSQNMLRCAKAYGIKETWLLPSAVNVHIMEWLINRQN